MTYTHKPVQAGGVLLWIQILSWFQPAVERKEVQVGMVRVSF